MMKLNSSVLFLLLGAGLVAACNSSPAELPAPSKDTDKESLRSSKTGKASSTTPAQNLGASRRPGGMKLRKPMSDLRKPAPKTETKGPDKVIPVAKGAAPAPLLKPEAATAKAPATFEAVFDTTKGEFTIEAHREWAPVGVDRFFNLIKIGYFDNVAFFRIKKDFMVQFGIHGHPEVNKSWSKAQIQDDPKTDKTQSNARGMVTFAKTGMPNSRTTQIFVNYGNNHRLDGMGFAPFGKITKGMEVLDSLYDGYGLALGNRQGQIQAKGNAFLAADYPKVDYINTVKIKEAVKAK